MVASVRQNYRGRWYSSGDIFEATKADACDLIAIRFAALACEVKTEDDARRYKRRDMEAER